MFAWKRPISLFFVAAWLLWPTPGDARLTFLSSDPSFTGATLEDFDPNPAPGSTHFTLTLSGVMFTFDTAVASPIVTCGNPADCMLEARSPTGIEITISPPVSSIGFLYQGAECFGQIRFTGAAGGESFDFHFGQVNIFVGAADIGDISKVTLNDPCFASWWDDMRFVPSTSTPPPTLVADLSLEKTAPAAASQLTSPTVTNVLTVDNLGPDTATLTQIVDFLPRGASFLASTPGALLDSLGAVATMTLGDLPSASSALATMELALLPFDASFPGRFGCDDALLNIALATSASIEPDSSNNLALATTFFDNTSRYGMPEICGNGIDDNCNGKTDCNDPACNCYPQLSGGGVQCSGGLQIVPGVGLITNGLCSPPTVPASSHRCCVPRGTCGDVCVDTVCCDPSRFSDPSEANQEYIAQHCDLGVPGCVPHDPNFKESSPGVNVAGYGHTEAGRTMTYTLHYENDGNAAAHDVLVLDTLDLDLDPSTLVINNGGVYDPATRTVRWNDPVVPPATPRSVSFSVAVRGDAAEGTVVRNVGTIVFPDAVPPSRVDTNFVEHTVVSPENPAVPELRVLGCTETSPGSGQWTVDLVNEGYGYAYNVTASILQPPASMHVTDPTASFQHPDDSDPSVLATVLPLATTRSADTVAFTTSLPSVSCAALNWCIQLENLQGDVLQQGTCTRCGDAHLDAGEQCDDGNNTDGDGCSAACAIENRPPDCQAAAPSVSRLWPPNHRLEPLDIVGVTDPDGDAVTVTIASIRQDEPVNATGDGDTAPDGFGAGTGAALLRSERSGGGNGRVYHVAFTAADAAGGNCTGEVTVCVPHDGKPGRVCVDEGPLFDSTARP